MNVTSIRNWVVGLGLLLLAGCGEDEAAFKSVHVTPANISLSRLSESEKFTLTADVIIDSARISHVTAKLEPSAMSFSLEKVETIDGGERWSVSRDMAVFQRATPGTYSIKLSLLNAQGKLTTEEYANVVNVME